MKVPLLTRPRNIVTHKIYQSVLSASKQRLDNVDVIRTILIVLLVFYHSFAIYSGGWPSIEGFPDIKVYWFLDKLSYAFMLETFVFISGFILGYQVRTKGEDKIRIAYLSKSKFKRLILPCVLFSFAYICLFLDIRQPLLYTIYDVFNGVGHMWFLPMLFWCFLFIGIVERIKMPPATIIISSLFLSILPYTTLPFRLHLTLYYFPFFYVGYYLKKNNVILEWLYRLKIVISLLITFLLLFTSMTYVSMHIEIWGGKKLVHRNSVQYVSVRLFFNRFDYVIVNGGIYT